MRAATQAPASPPVGAILDGGVSQAVANGQALQRQRAEVQAGGMERRRHPNRATRLAAAPATAARTVPCMHSSQWVVPQSAAHH